MVLRKDFLLCVYMYLVYVCIYVSGGGGGGVHVTVCAYMSTPSDAHLYNLLEKSIKSVRNP